jgi:hypothetical protein
MSMHPFEVYDRAMKADDAFHRELVKAFGKRRAGDMRYQPKRWLPENRALKAAALKMQRWTARWLKVMRAAK